MRKSLLTIVIFALVAAGANSWVLIGPHARVATRIEDVAPAAYGLVLGTGRLSGRGVVNPAYAARMDAAAALFRAGKVKFLIASGYHEIGGRATGDYDETADMREDLMWRGVPEANILIDDGPRRTAASILRLRCFAGDAPAVVISQEAHVARALFVDRAAGRGDWGFAARDAPGQAATDAARYEILSRFAALRDAAEIAAGLLTPPDCPSADAASPG